MYSKILQSLARQPEIVSGLKIGTGAGLAAGLGIDFLPSCKTI